MNRASLRQERVEGGGGVGEGGRWVVMVRGWV